MSQDDDRLERLLHDNPTEFERMLLSSTDRDVPGPAAAAALLERLDASLEGARVVSVEHARKLAKVKRASSWIFFAAALLGMAVIVLDRTRQPEHPIVRDAPLPAVPTNEPAPVAEVPAPPAPAIDPPVAPVAPVAVPPPSSKVQAMPKPKASATRLTDASFDKGAAAGAMGKVSVSECKAFPGPDGSGHVSVTFSPDGTVANAVVDSPPFVGTARGACVAGKFAQIRVPPFTGPSVRVGKTFVIEN